MSERIAAIVLSIGLLLCLYRVGLTVSDLQFWAILVMFELNWYLARRIYEQELVDQVGEKLKELERNSNAKDKDL